MENSPRLYEIRLEHCIWQHICSNYELSVRDSEADERGECDSSDIEYFSEIVDHVEAHGEAQALQIAATRQRHLNVDNWWSELNHEDGCSTRIVAIEVDDFPPNDG
jgi:hypothetical protein